MTDERALLELRHLGKSFGTTRALHPVDLVVRRGEFFALLGPSGCGKTTLLRLIAGLETPDTGAVCLNGMNITTWPAHRRPLNLVFQSYALFPHMDVGANIAFGLRQDGVPAAERRRRVADILDLVRMGDAAHRRPQQLSGGQQQRVALARTLVKRPAVLLLDEPMAALDRQLREEMQNELKRIQRELKTTFILVTHDQDEAMRLADRIAVMAGGRILQCATPDELYAAPVDRVVAGFFGEANLLPGRIASTEGAIARLVLDDGTPLDVRASAACGTGTDVYAVIRPERILLADAIAPSPRQTIRKGIVTARHFLGDTIACDIAVAGWGPMKLTRLNSGLTTRSLNVGTTVEIAVDADAIAVVPRDQGRV